MSMAAKWDWVLVPVVNPLGRQAAERGDFCLRENLEGVDINRNYDAHWGPETAAGANVGDAPFSSREAQAVRDLMLGTRPHAFMTVHSGTKGMYTPWAYSREEPDSREELTMLEALRDLDERYCQCPFGSAGRGVGYLCPGTCLDYAYETVKVPFSFGWEVYADKNESKTCAADFAKSKKEYDGKIEAFRRERDAGTMSADTPEGEAEARAGDGEEEERAEEENGSEDGAGAAGRSAYLELDASARVGARVTSLSTEALRARMSPDECFKFFNPDTEALYEETLRNWTSALLDLAKVLPTPVKGT
jgi:hypothetical protein